MTAGRLLGDWSVDPAVLPVVILAAAAYLAGVRRLAGRWPARRTAAFLAGLAVLLLASESGIEAWSERLLSVHMVAHLLIIAAAAPLLVGGAPVSLALRALRRRPRAGLLRLIRSRGAGAVAHPATSLGLFVGVLLATHVPGVYDAALEDPVVHGVEHAAYLASAVLFWMPVVGVDPAGHRLSPVAGMGYLLAAMIPMSAVGAALISSDRVVYAAYLPAARALGVSALADQRAGATIMWLGGTSVLVAATLAASWAGLVREERRARSREEQADRRRAAASGTGP